LHYVIIVNSLLTKKFPCVGGHAKTLMFVQVNPDVLSYTETLSTLKFAERVSGVELGVARTNKEGKDVRELTDQVTPPPPLFTFTYYIHYREINMKV
jgi:kinesin family protein C2/C3